MYTFQIENIDLEIKFPGRFKPAYSESQSGTNTAELTVELAATLLEFYHNIEYMCTTSFKNLKNIHKLTFYMD